MKIQEIPETEENPFVNNVIYPEDYDIAHLMLIGLKQEIKKIVEDVNKDIPPDDEWLADTSRKLLNIGAGVAVKHLTDLDVGDYE
jgi:hypothetical protein